jgi:hypothetical protein
MINKLKQKSDFLAIKFNLNEEDIKNAFIGKTTQANEIETL